MSDNAAKEVSADLRNPETEPSGKPQTRAVFREALLDPTIDAASRSAAGLALVDLVPELRDLLAATPPGNGHTAYIASLDIFIAAVRVTGEFSIVVPAPSLEGARAVLLDLARTDSGVPS